MTKMGRIAPSALVGGWRKRRNDVPVPEEPPPEIGPSDLLKDAKFKRSYVQAPGPLAKEPWLLELYGPAQPVKKCGSPALNTNS